MFRLDPIWSDRALSVLRIILNGGELAVLFCFVFLFFAIAGGGAWSLDRYIGKTPDTLSRRPA